MAELDPRIIGGILTPLDIRRADDQHQNYADVHTSAGLANTEAQQKIDINTMAINAQKLWDATVAKHTRAAGTPQNADTAPAAAAGAPDNPAAPEVIPSTGDLGNMIPGIIGARSSPAFLPGEAPPPSQPLEDQKAAATLPDEGKTVKPATPAVLPGEASAPAPANSGRMVTDWDAVNADMNLAGYNSGAQAHNKVLMEGLKLGLENHTKQLENTQKQLEMLGASAQSFISNYKIDPNADPATQAQQKAQWQQGAAKLLQDGMQQGWIPPQQERAMLALVAQGPTPQLQSQIQQMADDGTKAADQIKYHLEADKQQQERLTNAETFKEKQNTNAKNELVNATQTVAGATDPDSFKTWFNDLTPSAQARLRPLYSKGFSPETVAQIEYLGLTPEQHQQARDRATTAAEAAKRDAETAKRDISIQGYRAGELAATQQRNSLALKEYEQKYGDALGNIAPNNLAIAKKLATGDFNPTLLSRMPGKEQIIAAAIAINPNWDPQIYATKTAFTDPKGKQSQNLGTITRIVGHIGRFESNSQEMGMSLPYAMGVNLTGRQNRLNEDSQAISAELEKLVSGGVGTEGQVRGWQKALHSPSGEARQQAIDEISQLIGSQYEGMNQTYRAGSNGQDIPLEKYVTPAGRQWMRTKGINVGGAATAPAAGHGAPAAQPASGKITVTAPDGSTHPFDTQAQADAFKKLAGIK